MIRGRLTALVTRWEWNCFRFFDQQGALLAAGKCSTSNQFEHLSAMILWENSTGDRRAHVTCVARFSSPHEYDSSHHRLSPSSSIDRPRLAKPVAQRVTKLALSTHFSSCRLAVLASGCVRRFIKQLRRPRRTRVRSRVFPVFRSLTQVLPLHLALPHTTFDCACTAYSNARQVNAHAA